MKISNIAGYLIDGELVHVDCLTEDEASDMTPDMVRIFLSASLS